MKDSKHILRIVGGLFIIQMAAAVISYSVILGEVLYTQNYIASIVDNQIWVTVAMLLDILVGLAVFAIAVLLYPILKQYSERMALWYAGLRLIELVGFVVSGFLLMTLLSVSLNFSGEPHLQDLVRYFRWGRGHTQNITLLVYCCSASVFYFLLYKTRWVPRFISIWGLGAVALLFVEIVASIFRTSLGGLMIMMPMGLNEIFLGVWLMVKGFKNADLPW